MKEDAPRTAEYAKEASYEELVRRVNTDLARLGDDDDGPLAGPRLPVVFITGLPRSGTTLLYQVLAASGLFGYCTNLIARFFANPAFGARVQALLQPLLAEPPFTFESRGGRTVGWREPHEFGYFWEHFFPLGRHHQPTREELDAVDVAGLLRRLGALEAALGRPLLFKNLILDFLLELLAARLPTARFVRIRRPGLQIAQSIHRMRIEFYGSRDAWFSVRPRDAGEGAVAPVEEQIAHQMASIAAALDAAQRVIGPERWLEIAYRALCEAPHRVVEEIAAFAGVPGIPMVEAIPASFHYSEAVNLPADTREALVRALRARGLEP